MAFQRALADVLERRHQRVEVVTVDRADVVEAELLEQRGRHDHALGMFFQPFCEFQHRRRHRQHALDALLGGRVELAGEQAREVAVQHAHRRRDRHVVVVQHHQQRQVLVDAGVVHGLEGHAGGHCAVADHGDAYALLALGAGAQGHAQCGRDRGGRVRGTEGIELALRAAREARDTAVLAQRGHAVAAAGQDLVGIALVAHVPDHAVGRGIEHIVERNGQLHRAEVGRQVPAGLGDRFQHIGAQFVSQRVELAAIQLAQVCGGVDFVEQRVGHDVRSAAGFSMSGLSVQLERSTIRSASSASRPARVPNPANASWASVRNWAASSRAASRPISDT
ncbi:hypothetical protein D3C72_938360 [compost metagenome]